MPVSEPSIPEAPAQHECRWTEQFYKILDPDIEPVVRLLHEHGVFTLESCQGGSGHAYGYPTVLFDGERDTARAVRKLAREHGLRPIRVNHQRPLFYPIKPFWKPGLLARSWASWWTTSTTPNRSKPS